MVILMKLKRCAFGQKRFVFKRKISPSKRFFQAFSKEELEKDTDLYSVDFKRAFAFSAVSLCAYNGEKIKNCLSSCGFTDIRLYNYRDKNGVKPCAFALGKRELSNFTLVMIAVSGTVKKQWYSNFDLGEKKFHRGFYNCCFEIKKNLLKYLEKEKISEQNVRFFVTGHSRGGAAANLLGVYLSEKYGKKNVCCITFGAPNVAFCSENKKDYENIVNFENQNDIITVCPPGQWGFGKYGRIISLGEKPKTDLRRDFSRCAWEIAKDRNEYYRLRITSEKGKSFTLYEYFRVLAGLMSKKYPLGEVSRFMLSMNTQLEPLSRLVLGEYGENPGNIKPQDVNNLVCVKSHMGETYLKNILGLLSQ